MRIRAWLLPGALLCACAAWARHSEPISEPVSAKTEDAEISARLIIGKDAQTKLVGSDLKRQYAIVELTVTPRGGYPVTLTRDDFLLRSQRDNEHSTAESPERIAGSAVLVLNSGGGGGGTFSGPMIGAGYPGGYPGGYPYPGGGYPGGGYPGGYPGGMGGPMGGGAVGSGGSPDATSDATVAPARTKVDPLLATLQQKELRLGKTYKPVTGYLYFPVDPNQKVKNFHLEYKGPHGECDLRFK